MRFAPAPRGSPCIALLDDMSGGEGPRSRLYVGHAGTLALDDAAGLRGFLGEVEAAVSRGLHAVGLFAYELGECMQGMAARKAQPLAQVLLFEHCRRLTQPEVGAWLAAQSGDAPAGIAALRESTAREVFEACVDRIRRYIAAGDAYQVNYTVRLDFEAYGAPAALYARLRARQPVPYGAFIVLPDAAAVLSLSPELFLKHKRARLVAQPMKGTAPATGCAEEDALRADALSQDAKNRAENVMIVDLLRNDLGRVAATGSVSVPALFEVGRFGRVLQMTSTITAALRPGCSLADIFEAVFPCGSITGAPKRRSMEIIRELEPRERGLYTGGIGWFDAPQGSSATVDFCMSVPIRTLSLRPPRRGVRQGVMGVGAGIVADSTPAGEFDECRLKAAFLTGLSAPFELIETMRVEPGGECPLLPRHLARLSGSARHFGFRFDARRLRSQLEELCASLAADSHHRLRIVLHPQGRWELHAARMAAVDGPVRVFVHPEPLDADDPLLQHKTSARHHLDAAWHWAESRGGFDALMFNARGELAQGGRCNVFLQLDGHWFTPPAACGALPGVMRAAVLADPAWDAAERVLTRQDLERCQRLMVCNALRGTLEAQLHRTPDELSHPPQEVST